MRSRHEIEHMREHLLDNYDLSNQGIAEKIRFLDWVLGVEANPLVDMHESYMFIDHVVS